MKKPSKSSSAGLSQVWELGSFFKGGSSSSQLQKELASLSNEITKCSRLVSQKKSLKMAVLYLEDIEMRLHEADSFVNCLLAQDVEDRKAVEISAQITTLNAHLGTVSIELDKALSQLQGADFARLLKDKDLQKIVFALKERRDLAKKNSRL